jgi:hypothetical protein
MLVKKKLPKYWQAFKGNKIFVDGILLTTQNKKNGSYSDLEKLPFLRFCCGRFFANASTVSVSAHPSENVPSKLPYRCWFFSCLLYLVKFPPRLLAGLSVRLR